MFKPGKPKTGGRQKGTPNKRSVEFQKIMEDHDFCPAAAMIYCYQEAQKIFERRKKAGNFAGALEAMDRMNHTSTQLAQYAFPKKKAIEHSGELGVKTFADFIAAGSKKK